jgi:hypothetical protein
LVFAKKVNIHNYDPSSPEIQHCFCRAASSLGTCDVETGFQVRGHPMTTSDDQQRFDVSRVSRFWMVLAHRYH